MKHFNCIDEYNKYIHQIEEQIKNDQIEYQRNEEMRRNRASYQSKKDIEMRSLKNLY